ncbi:MAG: hypothetical protein ACLQGV_10225 [Bryobacteraceae bacterium]
MRFTNAAILALMFSVGVFAQHHAGAEGSSHPAPAAASPQSHHSSGGSGGVGYSTSPRYQYGGYRTVPATTYFYPVYVSGFDYPYSNQATSDVVAIPAPQAQAQPSQPVVINQYFGSDAVRPTVTDYGPDGQPVPPADTGVRVYQAPSNPPAEYSPSDQVVFFIALKDSSIYSAVAYWVDGEMLNYITPQGRHNQVSLALVDRDLSVKLNQGRQVDFHLPAAK